MWIYIYIYTCMCILFSFHIHVLKFENTTVAYAERTPSCVPMNPMTLAHQEAETQTSGFWQWIESKTDDLVIYSQFPSVFDEGMYKENTCAPQSKATFSTIGCPFRFVSQFWDTIHTLRNVLYPEIQQNNQRYLRFSTQHIQKLSCECVLMKEVSDW